MALQEEIRTEPCALALRVGRQIREERRSQNMTLAELAKLCGTTPQTLQRLEMATMTMSLHWVERIAEALGIDPNALFDKDAARTRQALALVRNTRTEAARLRVHIDHFLQDTMT